MKPEHLGAIGKSPISHTLPASLFSAPRSPISVGAARAGHAGRLLLRRNHYRRRCGRDVLRGAGRTARAADPAHRPFGGAGPQDPDLGRRALQFHQHRRVGRQFPFGQSAFRQVRAGPLHAGRLHRTGRSPPHRLAREDAWPAVLRRLVAANRRDAARRMRRRRRRDRIRPGGDRRASRRLVSTSASASRRPGAGTGARQRRPVDSEAGRDQLRL